MLDIVVSYPYFFLDDRKKSIFIEKKSFLDLFFIKEELSMLKSEGCDEDLKKEKKLTPHRKWFFWNFFLCVMCTRHESNFHFDVFQFRS